jgi:hypothetical protein
MLGFVSLLNEPGFARERAAVSVSAINSLIAHGYDMATEKECEPPTSTLRVRPDETPEMCTQDPSARVMPLTAGGAAPTSDAPAHVDETPLE